MLPISHAWKEGSIMDLIETTPKMELVIQDIEHLVEALRDSHALYRPLFQRREPREAAHTSLQGLLAELPRKSIEPLVLALEGVHPHAVRAMQAFISEGARRAPVFMGCWRRCPASRLSPSCWLWKACTHTPCGRCKPSSVRERGTMAPSCSSTGRKSRRTWARTTGC